MTRDRRTGSRLELLALACLELWQDVVSAGWPPSDTLLTALERVFDDVPAPLRTAARAVTPADLGLPPTAGVADAEAVAARLGALLDPEAQELLARLPVRRVPLPPLSNDARVLAPADVAQRLGLRWDELMWLADPQERLRRGAPEQGHYRYVRVPKRRGGERLLECPRPRLLSVQRAVLRRFLEPLVPHDAAMGFRPGVGFVDHAALHAGQAVVLRLDLASFFQTVRRALVVRALMHGGLARPTAQLLGAIATHVTHPSALRGVSESERARLRSPHLPQGAPTSPALANLVCRRLDARLTGLAASVGARYSRYADDLVLSGGGHLARDAERLVTTVGAIAIECGFTLNMRKTRVMRASQRQQLGGVVINAGPSLPRHELERLEATLTNCVRHGVAGQNRAGVQDFRAHLQGRVAWARALRPSRGDALARIFEQIDWST